ncbi:hypothetical protein IVB46_39540 [Bradyrhizobium sp. 61]|uniref:hypothetical protein n=1 Tax=unclassified Bradyrhizobium TaxID=2631580 RepID=UPI001FF9DD74|nr:MULTISPECIES: hypothetical protein [unclassified Bradyrhizobium]MCK1281330.1 hypothetical protein [Bradyrhizobium sp. 61]MCK1446134.1 hypothetical protein [Bradyrhizobium sp. 48]MCK1461235.1 hypothetical protein [Bradyrhizobium sp. 2]
MIWLNDPSRVLAERVAMNQTEEPRPDELPAPKPSRLDEARRVVEEYAKDLREIIQKLRRKLN